eukprot:768073-Rhodomonas_salina.1
MGARAAPPQRQGLACLVRCEKLIVALSQVRARVRTLESIHAIHVHVHVRQRRCVSTGALSFATELECCRERLDDSSHACSS